MTMSKEEISAASQELLKKEYVHRLVRDETGGYVATIHEFPGCVAEGDTAEEAIKNLDEAAASWIQVALSNGYEVREPVSFDGLSGKIALRIPRGLHKQVAELAELEETSINQLLVTAISQYVSGRRLYREMASVIAAEMRKAIASVSTVNIYPRIIVGALQGLPNTISISPTGLLSGGERMALLSPPTKPAHFIIESNHCGTC